MPLPLLVPLAEAIPELLLAVLLSQVQVGVPVPPLYVAVSVAEPPVQTEELSITKLLIVGCATTVNDGNADDG